MSWALGPSVRSRAQSEFMRVCEGLPESIWAINVNNLLTCLCVNWSLPAGARGVIPILRDRTAAIFDLQKKRQEMDQINPKTKERKQVRRCCSHADCADHTPLHHAYFLSSQWGKQLQRLNHASSTTGSPVQAAMVTEEDKSPKKIL